MLLEKESTFQKVIKTKIQKQIPIKKRIKRHRSAMTNEIAVQQPSGQMEKSVQGQI